MKGGGTKGRVEQKREEGGRKRGQNQAEKVEIIN